MIFELSINLAIRMTFAITVIAILINSIFQIDFVCGNSMNPQYENGDTLIIYKLDVLGTTTYSILNVMTKFFKKGVNINILNKKMYQLATDLNIKVVATHPIYFNETQDYIPHQPQHNMER